MIPKFKDEFSGTVTLERLHTSFLWVRDSAKLCEAIAETQRRYWDFKPFQPYTFRTNGGWIRFDAGASLYSAMPGICHTSQENELDSYDHLFLGSHWDIVIPYMGEAEGAKLRALHSQAKIDFTRLKGLWKLQEEYFEARKVE